MGFFSECKAAFKRGFKEGRGKALKRIEENTSSFSNANGEIVLVLPSKDESIVRMKINAEEPVFSAVISQLNTIADCIVNEDIVEMTFSKPEYAKAFLKEWFNS